MPTSWKCSCSSSSRPMIPLLTLTGRRSTRHCPQTWDPRSVCRPSGAQDPQPCQASPSSTSTGRRCSHPTSSTGPAPRRCLSSVPPAAPLSNGHRTRRSPCCSTATSSVPRCPRFPLPGRRSPTGRAVGYPHRPPILAPAPGDPRARVGPHPASSPRSEPPLCPIPAPALRPTPAQRRRGCGGCPVHRRGCVPSSIWQPDRPRWQQQQGWHPHQPTGQSQIRRLAGRGRRAQPTDGGRAQVA